jgi:hypothetical protein
MGRSPFKTLVAFFVSAALVLACSSDQYRYLPSEELAAGPGPVPKRVNSEATYQVPSDRPRGTLKIQSLGVVDIKPKGDSNKFPAIHLRISISNQSGDETWNFNIQEQTVSFPNQGAVHAIPVDSDLAQTPVIQLKPKDLRVLDLYFKLPDAAHSEKDLPQFVFQWQFFAAGQQVQGTTQFERVILAQYPDGPYPYGYPYYGPYAYGPGPYWGGVRVGVGIHVR